MNKMNSRALFFTRGITVLHAGFSFSSFFTFSFSSPMTMKFLLTLVLVSALFSGVLSLTCLNCLNDQCINIDCTDQCASLTVFVMNNGNNISAVLKSCAAPGICSPMTANLGETITTTNAICCNTTLCNNETLPVLPVPLPNGRTCYTCIKNDCTQTVHCGGNEDTCVTGTGTILGTTVTVKGCVAKSSCNGTQSVISVGNSTVSVQCCEGNLCNSAEIFTLSFLLMIISLHSSMFFY
ncbi:urokinase plasminogen activator surface receptor-like [Tachysurus fulvidraco]|uniref:urokinase plasminogen activator surface receptor-like n=1 Tax=Tachysurus fulvidraco TaxID=1234273 RepID=UPI001FEF38C0|nr:urokinase plasminogen activator surface receptor-like [Tachysurus fulvidraco]